MITETDNYVICCDILIFKLEFNKPIDKYYD